MRRHWTISRHNLRQWRFHTLLTAAFSHEDFVHLAHNMLCALHYHQTCTAHLQPFAPALASGFILCAMCCMLTLVWGMADAHIFIPYRAIDGWARASAPAGQGGDSLPLRCRWGWGCHFFHGGVCAFPPSYCCQSDAVLSRFDDCGLTSFSRAYTCMTGCGT